MSEDSNILEESKEPKDLTLIITFKGGGGMQVAGPGDGKMFDEPICLWMLEKAKDYIKIKNAQVIQSNLYVPDNLRKRM
jgi:hypothetical protein